MAIKQIRIPWYTTLLGLVFLIPITVWDWTHTLTPEDPLSAFLHPLEIPLDSIKATGSAAVQFEVPATKFPDKWGSLFYEMFWVTRGTGGAETIHDFSVLHMEVLVAVSGFKVPLSDAVYPYGYSADSQNVGKRFFVNPGDKVRIDVRTNDSKALPSGDLVIAADWTAFNKDSIVTLILDESVHRILRIFGLLGIVLVVFGLVGIRKLS